MGEPDARQAVEALEKNRAALLAAGWSDMGDRVSSRVSVVILKEHTDFTRYFGPNVSGIFVSVPRPSTIYLWGPAQHWGRAGEAVSTLRHELTHRISSSIYARQPRWFSEGLAKFLEALEISEDWSLVRRGYFNTGALQSHRVGRHVHVKDALEWKSYDGLDQSTRWGLYGESWLLVHWLYNVHPDEFTQLQLLFVKGVDPTLAWSQVMGKYALDQIDEDLERYAKFGSFQVTEVPFTTKPFEVKVKPMTEADADGLDARLILAGNLGPGAAGEARAAIERALAIEPGNTLALGAAHRAGRRFSNEDWLKRLRAQVDARPDDGPAWIALSTALDEQLPFAPETEVAFRRAIVTSPGEAAAYNNLAWFLFERRRPQEALPYSLKATIADPSSSAALDTHAAVLFELGRCADAVVVQRKAVDRLGEEAGGESELKERLEIYERQCP